MVEYVEKASYPQLTEIETILNSELILIKS